MSPSRFTTSPMMSGAPLTLGQVSRPLAPEAITRLVMMAPQGLARDRARSPARGGVASQAAAPDGRMGLISNKVQAATSHLVLAVITRQGKLQAMAQVQAGR